MRTSSNPNPELRTMLTAQDRETMAALWTVKLSQDANGLPQAQRHRNLEPASAEFICALAAGCGATRLMEIGGSSGLSTIALAAAARQTGGRLVSLEIEPERHRQSQQQIASLGLSSYVEFVTADASAVLHRYSDLEFVLIDCEKDDYLRFFDMLRLAPGAIVVADNILSHEMWDYVRAVRRHPGVESVTLPVGKGLEVSRVGAKQRGT
jgi:predicted O-methyltransferase YrrM